MTLNEQVRIMEKQLSVFDSFLEKVAYLSNFFDPDPVFTQEARDIVRGKLCKEFKPK